MVDTPPVLVARDISAGYGAKLVVRGVDLVLYRGDILGLMGANGSGKTTLLRALSGQRPLLSGFAAIDGIDIAQNPVAAKGRLGIAIDNSDLPACLSGRQFIELVASIRSCQPDAPLIAETIERLTLTRWLASPIAAYSLGTRAKLAIVAALLGEPPLLIFDESFNGLDPVAAWEGKRLVRSLAATGRHAIVVATHAIDAIPTLCNQAVFLAEGRVVKTWDAPALAETGREAGAFEAAVMQAFRAASTAVAP